MDRIGILIELMGKGSALSTLKQLQSLKNDIGKDKLQLKIDANTARRNLIEVEQEMKRLKAEKAEIRLGISKADLSTFDDLGKKIKVSEGEISRLEGKLKDILSGKGDTGDIFGIQRKLVSLREELEKFKAERFDIGEKIGGGRLDEIDGKLKELEKSAENFKAALKEIGLDQALDTAILSETKSQIDEITNSTISLQDALEGVASAFNDIGDVFGDIASIGSGFGDMLGNIAGMFSGGNILETVGKTLTYNATNAVTSRFGDIMKRFDIMRTFVPYMELAGVSASEAEESLERINKSILGLPIGLDEAAQRFRKYQMYVEDAERATNLTIGAQWAITAGGAADRYKTQAYNQIDYLLTAGELNSIRQWRSLMNGLGVSTRFLREEMGYAAMNNAEFTAALSKGDITVEEFLGGLEKLATSTGGIQEALEIYKSTLESWRQSIGFAITRGGESVLKGINELSKNLYGQEITDLAESFRDKINDVFADVDEYIGDHPEIFKSLSDSLGGLFGVLGKFDLENIATKTLENLGDVIDTITDAIDRLDPTAVEDFIAFGTTWAGPLSEAIAAISGGLPGLMAVFDYLRQFDWSGFVSTVLDHVDSAFQKIANILQILPPDLVNNALAFAIVDAPILDKVFHGIGKVIGTIAKIAIPTVAIVKLGGLGKAFKAIGTFLSGGAMKGFVNWKGYFTAIGGAAAFVLLIGEIGAVIREFAWVAQSIADLDLGSNFEGNLRKVNSLFGPSSLFAGILTGIGTALASSGVGGPAVLIGEGLAGGFVLLMMGVAKAIKMFAEAAQTIGTIDLTGYSEKVNASLEVIKNVVGALAGETFNADQAALAAQHIDDAVEHFVSIKESLEKLKDIDKIDIDFDAVTTALTNAYALVDEVNNAAGDKWVVDAKNNDSAIYEQYLTNMADSMEQISKLATALNTTKTQLESLDIDMSDTTANSPWEKLKSSIKQSVITVGEVFAEMDSWDNGKVKHALNNSENMPTIMKNMASVFENLVPIFDQFKEIKSQVGLMGMNVDRNGKLMAGSSWEAFKAQVDDVVEFIGGIYGKFEEKFPEVKNPKSEKDNIFGGNIAENINEIVTNSSTMFTELKQTLGFMKVLGEDLDQLDGKYVLGKGRVSLGEQLDTLAGQIETMFESIGTVIDTVKKYEGKSESAATAATNITNMSQSLEDIFTNLGELDALLEEHPQSVYTSDLAKVNNIMPTLGTLVETIAGFTMAGDVATKAEKLKETTGYVMGALQAIAQKSKMIENISENKLGEKVKTAIDEMMKGFKAFPENMDDVQQSASDFETAATSIINGVQAMKDNMEMIEEVAGGETALNLGQILFDMLSAVTGSFDLGTISTIASNLNEAISGLVETMSTLSTTDLSGLMESLGELGESVEELRGKLLDLQTQLQHTQTGCNNLRSAVESLANMMDGKQSSVSNFASSLNSVINQASTAASRVHALRDAISQLSNKEITITTNYVTRHNGGNIPGYIKHASGGAVDPRAIGMRAVGTDTVPAMLTPGEFVMRRAAVQKFGAGFMARLNSLNLDGALQLLYSARRLPQTVSSVINNARSYDNHATVNQNIYTNNQNYSHRRAYRYLRTV